MKSSKFILATLCSTLISASLASADPTSSTATETGDVSDVSGFALVAEARCGSNGNQNLPWPDFDLIDPGWNGDAGYITWDPNLDGGFNSGPDTVLFVADLAAGTASFSITDISNNTYTANYSGLSGTIQKVMLRSAVEATGHAEWSYCTVNFFSGGTCVESLYSGSPTMIDTNSTAYTAADQTLTVTPSSSSFTKVVVTGQVEFYAPDTAPGPNDLFNQLFLFTN